MRKIALWGDVHGNLEALEAVLRALPLSLDTRRLFADRLAEGT